MKIALVHNLPSGGGKRALYEFTRLLHQRGHVLDLYNLSLSDEQFLPLAPYVNRIVTSPINEFRLWQTRLLPFVIQNLNFSRKIAYLQKLEKLYASIARKIDHQNYDLVFVHHCKVLQSPYILRYVHTPSVYYCQEPPRRIYEPKIIREETVTIKQRIQALWYAPANALYHCKARHDDYVSTRSATLVLVNSYFSRESIYRVYGVNARVNYLGVDIEKFHPHNTSHKDNLVISVGRTYPEKGYDFIIRALSHIPFCLRPKLVIIADMRDPVEEGYLSSLAQQNNVEIMILSGISDAELVAWYQKAQLFIYAPIMEPFGLAPLEAMACGLPVIAVKEGGVRETVLDGETGFLTQRDPRELAEKLQFLLEKTEMRTHYGEQARRYAETSWTWERAVEELLENFTRVTQCDIGKKDSVFRSQSGSITN